MSNEVNQPIETMGTEGTDHDSSMYPKVLNVDHAQLQGLTPEQIYELVHQIRNNPTEAVDGLSETIPGKNPLRSKVVWANVVLFISAVAAIIVDSSLFTEYREVLLIIVAVLNVYMRFGTRMPLEPINFKR